MLGRAAVADHQARPDPVTVVVRAGPAGAVAFQSFDRQCDGGEAVRVCRDLRPDVVLMDVRMPSLDGIEATRQLAGADAPGPRVLILTTFDLDEYVFDALRAGASGFLLKDVTAERLFDAVRVIAAGEALLAPTVTRRLISEFTRLRPVADTSPSAVLGALTPRETEVLRLVAEGMSNPEIARRLVVTEETVKTHVSRILAKLGLRDRTQAVVAAYESGLVVPGKDRGRDGPAGADRGPGRRHRPGLSRRAGPRCVTGQLRDERYHATLTVEHAGRWQIDLTLWLHDLHRNVTRWHEELRERITAEQRIAVLRIKDHWHRQPGYPHHVGGLDIYTAVLDDGIRTLDQFAAWLAQHGREP